MNNTISNSDDVIDSRDVIARIEELEESLVPRYVAGWNMTGYMPDSEPAEFDDADDARTYIVERMREDAESKREAATQALEDGREDYAEHLTGDAEELESEANALEGSTDDEFSLIVAGTAYWINQDDTMGLDADELAELAALKALAEEAEGYADDWRHGAQLIRESYFEDYARELAEETGAITGTQCWPLTCIDWEQAARELAMDYTTVDFDGVDYLIR
jgi:hypothetical protein